MLLAAIGQLQRFCCHHLWICSQRAAVTRFRINGRKQREVRGRESNPASVGNGLLKMGEDVLSVGKLFELSNMMSQ